MIRVCAPPPASPSIEQMLAANPGKTPISLLQEYGTRIGKTPVYDLLKAEGQAHQPNFTFRVTVGDTSCTGEEGLGSLAGVCIHRALLALFLGVSSQSFCPRPVREGEISGEKPLAGLGKWVFEEVGRTWRVRGASRNATVSWQIVVILEEREEINRIFNEVFGGVSARCTGLCSRCLTKFLVNLKPQSNPVM